MAGSANRTTANTQVVIGNVHIVQDAIQTLITAAKTIISVTQVKASVWLIVHS